MTSTRTRTLLAAASPLLVLALAACGSGGSTPKIVGANTPAPARSAGGGQGVVGQVAAVSAGTLQVRSPGAGQVTVDFTSGTRITRQQSATLAGIATGDCLTATGAPDAAGLTARTVVISKPTNGSCADNRAGLGGGFGGGGGGRGARPSGSPRPSGAPRPSDAGDFSTLTGTVTAVSGTSITVTGTMRTAGDRATTSPSDTRVTVATDADTRYTETVAATSDALTVGACVAATGPRDDLGAVRATAIAVLATGQNGACGAGRMGASRSPGATRG